MYRLQHKYDLIYYIFYLFMIKYIYIKILPCESINKLLTVPYYDCCKQQNINIRFHFCKTPN